MANSSRPDRRLSPRAYVPAVATVLLENACVGHYVVRNLSPSGALLLGGPTLPEKTPCRLVLQGPGVGVLRLAGQIVRAGPSEGEPGIAFHFQDVSAEVEVSLRRVVETAESQRLSPSVLIVDSDVGALASLAEDIARLGQRTILALTPLEAIRWLSDTTVGTAVISCLGLSSSGVDLLAFIRQEFREIHRVLVLGALPVEEQIALLGEARAQACLRRPYTREALASALQPQRPMRPSDQSIRRPESLRASSGIRP